DHDGLGIADVVVAVGHGAVAPRVGYAGDRRRMANARLMVDVVGAPECRKLAVEICPFVGELGGAEPIDGVRPRLLANREQLGADLVDRLIPAHAGPLAVNELHRIFQAPVAVHELAHRSALGAMRAAIERGIPARLLADPHAVGHFPNHRAADRTMRTDVLADRDLRSRRRRRTGLCLAHAAERQRSEARETAGDEPGAAQEAAAIETAIWRLQRASESAATNVTFRSLDQHGCLPQLG